MRRLPPFQPTPPSCPLLPALELRPGDGVTGTDLTFHVHTGFLSQAPPHRATRLSLGKAGTRGLLKPRAPPAVSNGAVQPPTSSALPAEAEDENPRGIPRRSSLESRWQGRRGMQSKQIRVIGKKASHGGKGLGGNRRKVGSSSSSSSPVPPYFL